MEKELGFLVALWDASPVLGTIMGFGILVLYLKKAGIWGEPKEDLEITDLKGKVSKLEAKTHDLELDVAILLDWKKRDDK